MPAEQLQAGTASPTETVCIDSEAYRCCCRRCPCHASLVLLRAGARGRVVASVRPAVGLALLHLHGEDRCLEHEANVVLQGTKYVLRSDIVFGPPEV